MKNPLLILAVAAVAGYFAADYIAPYPPFTQISNLGINLGNDTGFSFQAPAQG